MLLLLFLYLHMAQSWRVLWGWERVDSGAYISAVVL